MHDRSGAAPHFAVALLRSALTWSAPAVAVLVLPWSAVLAVLAVVYGPAGGAGVRS